MARMSLIIAVFCLSTACATGGKERTGGTAEAEARVIALHNGTAKPEHQIVCKRERMVGSSMRRNVCRTKGQIEDQLKNSRDAMDRFNRQDALKGY
jgi:hypothetical protein